MPRGQLALSTEALAALAIPENLQHNVNLRWSEVDCLRLPTSQPETPHYPESAFLLQRVNKRKSAKGLKRKRGYKPSGYRYGNGDSKGYCNRDSNRDGNCDGSVSTNATSIEAETTTIAASTSTEEEVASTCTDEETAAIPIETTTVGALTEELACALVITLGLAAVGALAAFESYGHYQSTYPIQ